MRVVVVVGMTGGGDGCTGGEDEPAGLDSFRADQAVGELADDLGGTSEEDDFEAAVGVEVDVGGGHDAGEVEVLELVQAFADAADVVVVDEGDDSHGFAVVARDGLFNERITHEPANRLAAVGILVLLPVEVELLEQFAADRDAEADECVFHGC